MPSQRTKPRGKTEKKLNPDTEASLNNQTSAQPAEKPAAESAVHIRKKHKQPHKKTAGPVKSIQRPGLGLRLRAYFSAYKNSPRKDILYLMYASCYYIGAHIMQYAQRYAVLVQEIFIWLFGRILLGSIRRMAQTFRKHVLNAIAASVIQDANFFIKSSVEISETKKRIETISLQAKSDGASAQLVALEAEQKKYLGQCRRQLRVQLTTKLSNYLGPALAAVFLVIMLNQFFAYTVALSIQYDGKNLGYIENEKVFDTAANDIEARVISGDKPFYVDDTPLYKVAFVKKSQVSELPKFSDNLLSSIMGDQVNQACGIYLDGRFLLAVKEEEQIQNYMQNLLNPYLTSNTEGEVGFLNKVEYRSGLYPIDSIRTYDQAISKLNSKKEITVSYTVAKNDTVAKIASKNGLSKDELIKLNPDISGKLVAGKKITLKKQEPFLQVKVVKIETYNEAIAYETTTKKDSSQYEGYSFVKTKGKNGTRKVTANVIYVDGIEVGREVLSTSVVEQPRNEVKVVGTKATPKYAPSVSDYGNAVTGKFMYPTVPGHISCGWLGYPGHRGVDLSAKVGTPIYAADGGVVQAVYRKTYGYGLHIIVNHGNGYTTLYAHLSKSRVSVGDKVSKGQVIALSGNTGRTTGPHLHFEIRVNGVQVNPTPYIR